MCVNKRLLEGYNLTGYSTINHCDAESDDYGFGMFAFGYSILHIVVQNF